MNRKRGAPRQKAESRALQGKIRSGAFKIAVYGLGHVGSPLASVWLRARAHVIGVDNSPAVLANAKRGKTHVPEPGVNEAYAKGLKEKRFRLYDDPVKASQDSHLKLICVPARANWLLSLVTNAYSLTCHLEKWGEVRILTLVTIDDY